MEPLLWVASTAGVLWLGDRGLRAAEARGWIYYRRRPDSGSVSGALLGPTLDLLQPTRQITVEQQERDRVAPAAAPQSERR